MLGQAFKNDVREELEKAEDDNSVSDKTRQAIGRLLRRASPWGCGEGCWDRSRSHRRTVASASAVDF